MLSHNVNFTFEYALCFRYKKALNLLWKCSPAAQRHILRLVNQQLIKEVRGVTCAKQRRKNTVNSLSKSVTMSELEAFNWSDVDAEIGEKMPILRGFVDACMPGLGKLQASRLKGKRRKKR